MEKTASTYIHYNVKQIAVEKLLYNTGSSSQVLCDARREGWGKGQETPEGGIYA